MLLGVVLLLGSCLLFGEMLRTEAANEAMSIPIKVGTEITTDFVNVQTSKNCMIAFDLTVQSEKVHISQSTDPQTSEPEEEYKLQYGFPLTYRILDANGNTIHSKTTKIAWKSDELYTDRGDVDSPDGGTITVKRKFTTFKVRDPGRLQVRVEVQPDSEFGAELSSAHLIVYGNVPEPDDSVLRGFAFYIASPLLITLGAILTIVGMTRSGPVRTCRIGRPEIRCFPKLRDPVLRQQENRCGNLRHPVWWNGPP